MKDSATQSKLLRVRLVTQPTLPSLQGKFSEKTLGVDREEKRKRTEYPCGQWVNQPYLSILLIDTYFDFSLVSRYYY